MSFCLFARWLVGLFLFVCVCVCLERKRESKYNFQMTPMKVTFCVILIIFCIFMFGHFLIDCRSKNFGKLIPSLKLSQNRVIHITKRNSHLGVRADGAGHQALATQDPRWTYQAAESLGMQKNGNSLQPFKFFYYYFLILCSKDTNYYM